MNKKITKLLFVEDGSIDMDDLEDLKDLGIKVIVYRQNAQKPELLNLHNEKDVEAIGFNIQSKRDNNENDKAT